MKVNWSFIRLHRLTVQFMMYSEIITVRVHEKNTGNGLSDAVSIHTQ